MATGFRLKQISISGFRGYGEQRQVIDLASPIVLLIGNNRSGKSSTLNAIEWALYGSEVVGKKIGIEERKGWRVVNLSAKKAHAELIISTATGDIKVVRSQSGSRKSGETFYYIDGGKKYFDETGLWTRLGLDAKDFMSSVYLHQEVVRDILVTTPKVRKDALDRLLGVSELRSLREAFSKIRRSSYENCIADLLEDLEDRIETRTKAYREQIEDAREEGREMGLTKSDFTLKGMKDQASHAITLLKKVASKARVKITRLSPPSRISQYEDFVRQVRLQIQRLRSENPAATTQHNLYKKRRRLEELQGSYEHCLATLKNVKNKLRALEKRHGSLKTIKNRIGHLESDDKRTADEVAKVSDRIAIVDQAISYLKRLPQKKDQIACPVCEQPVRRSQLLKRLVSLREQASKETENLLSKRKMIGQEIRSLKKTIDDIEVLSKEDLPDAKAELRSVIEEISRETRKKIKDSDDPVVIIEKEEERIEKQLEKNKRLLGEYTKSLSLVEDVLTRIDLIGGALETANKIKQVESITSSNLWKTLRHQQSKLMQMLDDIEKLAHAISSVHVRVTRTKLGQAEKGIVEYYRTLVHRPDFDAIEISQDDFDVYAISNGKRQKVISVFNQGDMNCVALSIFLALAANQTQEGPGFVMLDDPSQSLDSIQKKRLADVINKASASKQIILATMDEELATNLMRNVTKRKKVYQFGEWDPHKGPSITEV